MNKHEFMGKVKETLELSSIDIPAKKAMKFKIAKKAKDSINQ